MTASAGTIGGWTIDDSGLLFGTGAQTSGQLNIQFHSGSSVAGTNFYSWGNSTGNPNAYLAGLSLTWHEGSNAGHLVMGQLAATVDTLKTDFFGIQMAQHTEPNFKEYFALSAKSTGGATEVYNRIAGWSFDENEIAKGAVTMSANDENIKVTDANGVVRVLLGKLT